MDVCIADVHLDLGAGRRGTDMGPSAIHVAGLIKRLQSLGHQIAAIKHVIPKSLETLRSSIHAEELYHGIEREIAQCCHQLRDIVYEAKSRGQFPLILGGDHSQAVGSVAGLAQHYRQKGERLGLVWVDAHLDMNTPETSLSGNIHGMPLACILGQGSPLLLEVGGEDEAPWVRPENVVLLGARDVDAKERVRGRQSGIRIFSMEEIDERGIGPCVKEAIALAAKGTAAIHLSFDLDGVDPEAAPGVGTPVPGGLTLRESHFLCEKMAQSGLLSSCEFVEVNPTQDIANKTAELALWLAASAMGQKIL